MEEAQLEDLKDFEIDLNNLDQQRSEYQRLQSEADKKTAAKKGTPNDSEDKKLPAVDRQQPPTPQLRNHQTIPSERTKGISNEDVEKWLCQHKAKASLDGVVQADCPIPPQVQQWLENEQQEVAALRQLAVDRQQASAETSGTYNTADSPTWLRQNNARVAPDGVIHADRPVPLYVHQWIGNHQCNLAVVQQLTARSRPQAIAQAPPTTTTGPPADTLPTLANVGTTNNTNHAEAKQSQEEDSKLPAVDMTQGVVRVPSTAPPQADHPVFSPSENTSMHEDGIRILEGKIYAPEGINKRLKRFWEQRLADGKLHQPPTSPPPSSNDSDSTPPKCNRKKPAVARKKPAIKKPTGANRTQPSSSPAHRPMQRRQKETSGWHYGIATTPQK